MMFFPAAILFLVSGVLSLPLFEKHEDLEPVDIISVKHLQINSYTGPLTAEMFKLLKNVEILELSESNFTLLEDRLLHNLPNLRKLSISNSHIVREVHDISSCCQKLKEIEMINSGLSSLPWNQIGVKWPIETIYLFREKTPELEANILVDKKLKHLTLIHSDLEKIDEGAFNGVNHLETLNLENNKIGKITKRTLEPLKTLKELNLSHNLLEEITADQIPNLPHLEKLNIGHNPIKKINLEEIKKLLPKLTTLDVSGIDNIDLSKVGDLGDLQLVKTAVL